MTTGTFVAEPLASAAAAGVLARLDAPATAPRLKLYGAPRPDYGAAPGSAVLVGDIQLGRPAGVVSSGVLVLSVPTAGFFAMAAVAPVWARLEDGDGFVLSDMRARLLTVADDPADPARVVVQATVVEVGALLRVTVGSISFLGG